jgi:hypothetical protein
MKLTRRQLASGAPAILWPAALEAQPAAPSPDVELTAARERLKSNADALRAAAVPMDTEPAFQFKA